MKSIKLKVAKENITFRTPQGSVRQEVIVNTAQIIFDVVNEPVNGFRVSEMMQRIRIAEPVEKFIKQFELPADMLAKDIPEDYFKKTFTLKLEDEDYAALKTWCENFEFHVVSKFIAAFVNELK
jgi:hypothetical protein